MQGDPNPANQKSISAQRITWESSYAEFSMPHGNPFKFSNSSEARIESCPPATQFQLNPLQSRGCNRPNAGANPSLYASFWIQRKDGQRVTGYILCVTGDIVSKDSP